MSTECCMKANLIIGYILKKHKIVGYWGQVLIWHKKESTDKFHYSRDNSLKLKKVQS